MSKSGIIGMAVAGLELPADLVGAVRLTLIGQELLRVINHRGIIVYEPQRVILAISRGRLEICGVNLSLAELNNEQLTVEGQIQSILFKENDNEK